MEPLKYKKYEEKGFGSFTGKVELYSTAFEKHGYDPLPFYREPPESPVSTPELLEEYPLVLYTGGRHIEFFHSEGRQIPALRERVPDPLVEIHPDTATDAGIEDGDWVWLKAKVTANVHPSMVHARHGWWFPEKPPPEHGCFESNINVVTTDDPPREEICASVRTRGTLCKIYK
jgi:anaerobic selenocysteine-containing dehydrogenase